MNQIPAHTTNSRSKKKIPGYGYPLCMNSSAYPEPRQLSWPPTAYNAQKNASGPLNLQTGQRNYISAAGEDVQGQNLDNFIPFRAHYFSRVGIKFVAFRNRKLRF